MPAVHFFLWSEDIHKLGMKLQDFYEPKNILMFIRGVSTCALMDHKPFTLQPHKTTSLLPCMLASQLEIAIVQFPCSKHFLKNEGS